jgi:hypothetical protein
MFEDSAGQDDLDNVVETSPSLPYAGPSDSALLEIALQEAIDAHAAGILAAPFGVDDLALIQARHRAGRSDMRRLLTEDRSNGPHPTDCPNLVGPDLDSA